VFLEQDPRFTTLYPLVLRLAILDIDRGRITPVEAGDRVAPHTVRWNEDSETFRFAERDGYGTFVNTIDARTGRVISRRAKQLSSESGLELESADRHIQLSLVQEAPFERILVSTRRQGSKVLRHQC